MGTGSTGGGGAGYRVEVDNLRAFASRVRGLLSEFQAGADGGRTHGATGIRSGAFGSFAEAEALQRKYAEMRDSLKVVLDDLHDMIDEAQRKADQTAANYEEQEHETSRHLKVGSDGWSVATPSGSGQPYGGSGNGSGGTRSAGAPATQAKPAGGAAVPGPAAGGGSGAPKPTW